VADHTFALGIWQGGGEQTVSWGKHGKYASSKNERLLARKEIQGRRKITSLEERPQHTFGYEDRETEAGN